MTIQSGKNPGGLLKKIQNALNGVQQELPAGTTVSMSGQTVTQAQLVTQLSGMLPKLTAVMDAKTAHALAVQARKAVEPDAWEYLATLRAALVAFYGRGSPTLEKFGMSAKKPAPQTLQTATLAAAKRTLTRQKRGTLGKRQKASIKAVGTPQVSIGESGVQIAPAAVEQPVAAPVETPPAK
jgi:hypothetical protein